MIGSGTTFGRSADDGSTYTVIANILDMQFPSMTRTTSESSKLDSVDDYKEFTAGMRDAGEMEITFEWDFTDTGQGLLFSDFDTGTEEGYYQVTFPDSTTFTFRAWVTNFGKNVPKEEDIGLVVGFKLSGRPVEA